MKIYFMTFKRPNLSSLTHPEIKNHLQWFDPDVTVRCIGCHGACFVATKLDVDVFSRISNVYLVIDVTYSVIEMAKLIDSSPEVSA